MIAILVFPILILFIAGFLSLIVLAIVQKKWALLFIPLGIVILFTVFIGFKFVSSGQPERLVHSRAVTEPIQAVQDTHDRQGNSSDENAQVAEYSLDSNVKVTRGQPNVRHTVIEPDLSLTSLFLLIIGLIALVVFIVIAISRKKWAMLFIPLGVAALGVLSIFYLRVGHISPRQEQKAVAEYPQMIEAAADKPLPAVWSPGIEKEFQADVYYSKASALRGVASRLGQMIRQQALNGQVMPEKLALLTYRDQFSKDLIDQAIGIFKDILPDIECYTVAAGKESLTKDDAWVSMELTESPGQPGNIRLNGAAVNSYLNKDNFKNGNIKASIHLKSRTSSFSLRFTEKPWLDNFSAFNNSYSGQYAIAYSRNTVPNDSQARTEALKHAQQIVNKMLLDISPALPQVKLNISPQQLSRYGFIVDEFTQSLQGSSTPIFRHALLLDISPEKIQSLAQQKINGYKAARQSWAYHIMSAIGIALVICVIYFILNAATKGYYTVVLRILTVIGIIAVVLLLTMV